MVGLLLVFGLILATNLIDRKNFDKVAEAIDAIYEDRLVAKGFLFDLSMLVHQKQLDVASADTSRYLEQSAVTNQKIDELLSRYSETNLTQGEVEALEQLKKDLEQLLKVETRMRSGQVTSGEKDNLVVAGTLLTTIHEDLVTLSNIQILEGERQMQKGKAAVESIGYLTDMEIYVLIALGIVIQVLLISGVSRSSKQDSSTTS